jgi:hypothetical protein
VYCTGVGAPEEFSATSVAPANVKVCKPVAAVGTEALVVNDPGPVPFDGVTEVPPHDAMPDATPLLRGSEQVIEAFTAAPIA